jgi:hypothetical protein
MITPGAPQTRVADKGHREVEPAMPAAGVRGSWFPSLLDQVELLDQLACLASPFAPVQVTQVGHEVPVRRR